MSQLKIDFEYDDRLPGLALEFGIILAPCLAPGTTREEAAALTARLAKLAERVFVKLEARSRMVEERKVSVLKRLQLRRGRGGRGRSAQD